VTKITIMVSSILLPFVSLVVMKPPWFCATFCSGQQQPPERPITVSMSETTTSSWSPFKAKAVASCSDYSASETSKLDAPLFRDNPSDFFRRRSS